MNYIRWVVRKLREQIRWCVIIPFRSFYWRLLVARMGPRTRMLGRVLFIPPEQVSIGHDCTFNDGVYIAGNAPITIGNYVRIAAGVKILSGSLNYSDPMERRTHKVAPVVIEDGVWIAANAVICPGVVVGRDSVVAAGSTVLKDVPENVVVFGAPARITQTIERPPASQV